MPFPYDMQDLRRLAMEAAREACTKAGRKARPYSPTWSLVQCANGGIHLYVIYYLHGYDQAQSTEVAL